MVAESIYKDYQKQLLNGNRLACKDIVENLLKEGIQVRDIYLNLFQRSLYEVGALWEANKISVAIEHMCTAITESLINIVYPYLSPQSGNEKKVVVMCTPGEYHQVGARIVADYFEINQWNSYFLGVNTPEKELFKFLEKHNPDLLAVSLSVFFNINALSALIKKINLFFPGLKVILGGQGFRWGGKDSFNQYEDVSVMLSLDTLDQNIFNPPHANYAS